MLAFGAELLPFVHREETPVGIGTGLVTLAAAGLAAAVLALSFGAQADTIFMKGTKLRIEGKVLRETDDYILLMVYNDKGQMENPSFLDYRVPVASDVPMIEAVMVEVPNPRHPFGARGVGEVPIVPPMAAVANAIFDAIGMRMRDLPISPPKLRAALDAQEPPRLAAE